MLNERSVQQGNGQPLSILLLISLKLTTSLSLVLFLSLLSKVHNLHHTGLNVENHFTFHLLLEITSAHVSEYLTFLHAQEIGQGGKKKSRRAF